MKTGVLTCALLVSACVCAEVYAQDEDYLSDGEVTAVRDTQEPDKRLILYMNFAQRRIDGIKETLSSDKRSDGALIRQHLTDYVRIMEDVDSTMEDARDRRAPLSKALKDIELRGKLFLNTLQSFNSNAFPAFNEYKYTLEEAIDMTQDELAEAAKGDFPEVKERKPPTDLPPPSSRPPADAKQKPDAGSKAGDEGGPPRKSQRQ